MDLLFKIAMLSGAGVSLAVWAWPVVWPKIQARLPGVTVAPQSTTAERVAKWEALRADCEAAGCSEAVAALDVVFPALARKAKAA